MLSVARRAESKQGGRITAGMTRAEQPWLQPNVKRSRTGSAVVEL